MTITTNKPFTKSAFKIALSCPTKLYYARHPELYANSNDEDEFLAALAEGGFQCGIIRTHPRLELLDNTPGHRSWQATAEGTADYPQRFIYRVSEHQLSMRIESCKPFFD